MEEQPKRILLVEDDRFLRKAAEATLRRHGFTVSAAADGEEALLRAREGPDLILLDLIMPKLQGFEVLRILKQDPTTKQIPIVVLSNLGQESDVQQTLQGGAVAYFIKANRQRNLDRHRSASPRGRRPDSREPCDAHPGICRGGEGLRYSYRTL